MSEIGDLQRHLNDALKICEVLRKRVDIAERALQHISAFDDHGRIRSESAHSLEARVRLEAYNKAGAIARATLAGMRT